MEKTNRFTIKEWAEEDRPQERLLRLGPSALSLSELLAIVLRTGTATESAVDLSKRIMLGVKNDLSALGKMSAKDLQKTYKGIGQAKAAMILAVLELGKRRMDSAGASGAQRLYMNNSRLIFDYMYARMADLSHEESWVLLLNSSNRLLDVKLIGKGGLTETLVDMRLVLKYALEALATKVVLCHNHPSGNPRPSKPDLQLTEKLRKALHSVDIYLVDHLIICDHAYFSFADEHIF